MINVLFVGGGRRVSLAKRFIQHDCKIFSYETDVICPIAEVAEIIHGFRWKDFDLVNHLKNVCISKNIELLIPLQDEAISICANVSKEFNIPCPASYDSADICFDKCRFASHMKYKEYPDPLPSYKTIVKPRFGFSSKGITVTDYLSARSNQCSNDVLQRFIEGTEFSVDCYFNKNSELIDYIPRQRIVVQGGEVINSITMSRGSNLYTKIGDFIRKAFKDIGAVGPYCIQFIVDTNNIYIIEANARFGGGVILSLEAGFDIIQLILDEYIHKKEIKKVENPQWKECLIMKRYFSEYFY